MPKRPALDFAQIPDDEAHEQDQTGKQHGHRDIGELFFRHAVLLSIARAEMKSDM